MSLFKILPLPILTQEKYPIISAWIRSDPPYKLYVFNFDRTLLKIHSWMDRDMTKPLNRDQFLQYFNNWSQNFYNNPCDDFYELDFLKEFFTSIVSNGSYVAIVSDQWVENVEHYLEIAKLSSFFCSRKNSLPINLIGRQKSSNINRIGQIIDSIYQKTGQNIHMSEVIFYDDCLTNIHQLKISDPVENRITWKATGIWLAKKPFGEYVIKSQFYNKIPYLGPNSQEKDVDLRKVSPNLVWLG